MKTQITFRHFNKQHPKLHQAAEEIADSFTKYNSGILNTSIEFLNDVEKTVNFTLNIQGTLITASVASDDFHKSLNIAADKIIKQITKHKEKRTENRKNIPRKSNDNIDNNDNEDEEDIQIEIENEQ